MNDVNKLVSQHYKSKRLPRYRKENLLRKLAQLPQSDNASLTGEIPPQESTGGRFQGGMFRWYHYATVSMLLLIGVALAYSSLIDNERSDMALRDAALYHKTRLQLDFKGQSLAQLRS